MALRRSPISGNNAGGCSTSKQCSTCTLGDCEYSEKCKVVNGYCIEKTTNSSCKTSSECYQPGKLCSHVKGVGCVCKSGHCKISCMKQNMISNYIEKCIL